MSTKCLVNLCLRTAVKASDEASESMEPLQVELEMESATGWALEAKLEMES